MSRILQYFNFLGVMALAVLCAVQWQANSRLTRRTEELDDTRQAQTAKLADQEKTIKANAADLDELHKRLTDSDAANKEAETKLAVATAERDAAIKAREGAKAAIETRWKPAITQRDDYIKQLEAGLQKAQATEKEAMARYNDLTGKYNALMEANAKANK